MAKKVSISLILIFVLLTSLAWVVLGAETDNNKSPKLEDIKNSKVPFMQAIAEAYSKKRPILVIFSYEGDCCASTAKWYADYHARVQTLLNTYGNKLDYTYINYGKLNADMQKDLKVLTQKYGLKTLPSLIIISAESVKFQKIEGLFDLEDAIVVIDKTIK